MVLTFSEEFLFSAAREYFRRSAGAERPDLLKAAEAVRLAVGPALTPQASAVEYDGFYRPAQCTAFALIDSAAVDRTYVFALTVGAFPSLKDDPLGAFLADAWTTAYTDAARDALESSLRDMTEDDLTLSVVFGPGFYGMAPESAKAVCAAAKAGLIGITITDAGLMLPLKSVCGIYFVTAPGAAMPGPACAACAGSPRGCRFCKLRNQP